MKLTVIGCSGSFPGPDSACSCYLVEAEGFRVLLDLGSGALGPLQRHVDLADLDAVLLSHLHADHCLGWCDYYVVRRYHPQGAMPPIPVYGPANTVDRLSRASSLPGESSAIAEFIDFTTLRPSSFELGPFQVTVDRVNHPVETYAMRLAYDGRSVTYSGDTDECEELARLAADTDLLLADAAYLDGRDVQSGVHMTGRAAGEQAARAQAGRLVLTHIPPWTDAQRNLDAARTTYAGPVELARPHVTYSV